MSEELEKLANFKKKSELYGSRAHGSRSRFKISNEYSGLMAAFRVLK